MKVAILSESPADEAAIRILVNAIRSETIAAELPPSFRARGVESVFTLLPVVIKHLHYHSDADALVVVVDSNHTPIGEDKEGPSKPRHKRCRLTRLREQADATMSQLADVPRRHRLNLAFGLAVPAVEAWYLCRDRRDVSERTWIDGVGRGSDPYNRNQLKHDVYGTDRPSLQLETRLAVEKANEVASCMDLLTERFPFGFGSLRDDVQRWRSS